VFQFDIEDLLDLYMDSVHCDILGFKGNHAIISPHGTENTRIDLEWFRCCTRILSSHQKSKGGNIFSSEKLRIPIGLKVILLLEAKFPEILARNCDRLKKSGGDILVNGWVTLLIKNWSAVSRY
jgi:hypothetical protein